jgi:hypothetical protein
LNVAASAAAAAAAVDSDVIQMKEAIDISIGVSLMILRDQIR